MVLVLSKAIRGEVRYHGCTVCQAARWVREYWYFDWLFEVDLGLVVEKVGLGPGLLAAEFIPHAINEYKSYGQINPLTNNAQLSSPLCAPITGNTCLDGTAHTAAVVARLLAGCVGVIGIDWHNRVLSRCGRTGWVGWPVRLQSRWLLLPIPHPGPTICTCGVSRRCGRPCPPAA